MNFTFKSFDTSDGFHLSDRMLSVFNRSDYNLALHGPAFGLASALNPARPLPKLTNGSGLIL